MKTKFTIIQSLRGLAAMIVVLHHISAYGSKYTNHLFLNDVFKVGWNGVDFFFVLSGFIMTYIHFSDIENRINLKEFLYKRFIRIYPIYWIIATIVLATFLAGGKLNIHNDVTHIIQSYLLIKQDVLPFLAVAWSLVYEVLFYIFFSTFLIFGIRYAKTVVVIWFATVVVLNLTENELIKHMAFNNYNIEFLLGCASGYFFVKYKNKSNAPGKIMLILGVAIFILTWLLSLYSGHFSKFTMESRFSYGAASVLIIVGSAFMDVQSKSIKSKLLLLIGDASYVIYLIHLTVILVFYKLYDKFIHQSDSAVSHGIAVLCFITSVAVGILFHIFVEKRLLELLSYKKLNNRKVDINR